VIATVVFAHPDSDSYGRVVLDRVVGGLERAGHHVNVIDLYAIDYPGSISPAEWQAYASGAPILDDVVAEHAAAIRSSEALVFVYPTWWSSVPAILKAWIERTLVEGVAFTLEGPKNRLTPKLGGVRNVAGVTTYGSSWWYVKLVNDAGRRMILRTTGLLTVGRARLSWLALYSLDGQTPARRARFLDDVERAMEALR
jgi:putative NADPH-quinone reductase